MNDPYKVLNVSPDASEEEVIKAYRLLAKKYHPDLNPNDKTAAAKMSEVNAAYDAIKSGKVYSNDYRTSYPSGGNYTSYNGQTYDWDYFRQQYEKAYRQRQQAQQQYNDNRENYEKRSEVLRPRFSIFRVFMWIIVIRAVIQMLYWISAGLGGNNLLGM